MKVKALMKLLAEFDQNAEVILQKDSEGNGYSPLSGADHDAVYTPESTWSGTVFSTEWSAQDACMEDEEWQVMMKKKRCVVLYPIN